MPSPSANFHACQREKYIESKMASCRHFTGVQNDTCLVGISYEAVREHGPIPCVPIGPNQRETCNSKSVYTRDEAEVMRDEKDRRMAKSMLAMNAAHSDAKEKGLGRKNGGTGSVKCPVCTDGTIHYSVAGYNGHMHVGCTTKGCVSWME